MCSSDLLNEPCEEPDDEIEDDQEKSEEPEDSRPAWIENREEPIRKVFKGDTVHSTSFTAVLHFF